MPLAYPVMYDLGQSATRATGTATRPLLSHRPRQAPLRRSGRQRPVRRAVPRNALDSARSPSAGRTRSATAAEPASPASPPRSPTSCSSRSARAGSGSTSSSSTRRATGSGTSRLIPHWATAVLSTLPTTSQTCSLTRTGSGSTARTSPTRPATPARTRRTPRRAAAAHRPEAAVGRADRAVSGEFRQHHRRIQAIRDPAIPGQVASSVTSYLPIPPVGIEPTTFGLKVRCSAS